MDTRGSRGLGSQRGFRVICMRSQMVTLSGCITLRGEHEWPIWSQWIHKQANRQSDYQTQTLVVIDQITNQSHPTLWHGAMPQWGSYPDWQTSIRQSLAKKEKKFLEGISPAITGSEHYNGNWVTTILNYRLPAIHGGCKQGPSKCGTGEKKYQYN